MLQRIPEGCWPDNKENMLDKLRILRQSYTGWVPIQFKQIKVFARFMFVFAFEWRNCLRFISFVFARLPILSGRGAPNEPSTRRLHCNYRQRRLRRLFAAEPSMR